MEQLPALSFASLLRGLRADAGLTQEALAHVAGLSPRSVSDLERGINRTARQDTALLLADALRLTGPRRASFVAAARGKVLPSRPTNLPGQLTAFVGRVTEQSEVRALAGSSRLVTLTGPGGCGKTRLGLQVAEDLLDGWADGVWLAELAAVTDPDAVPAAIAAALGIQAQPAQPALDTLADALAPQDVLIVLDNCEHLLGGCAKTAETILRRCPKVRLISTSREPLGVAGEMLYRVPSLSLPEAGDDDGAAARSCDAVALLADRASAQGIHLDVSARAVDLAVSVCRRLDGMPLAIELAAARMRSMSLAELSDRLDQRFRLLTGGRTTLPRQQTLHAAIGWSYSLLTPAERLLLGRLSVFAGGFDLAAAEAVCGYGTIDAAEVAGLLGSLVDKSLVVTEPAAAGLRYRLLETIRLFAAERLAESDQEPAAAREAHCAHYLVVAEAAAPHLVGSEQGSWQDQLEADHANLRRAAEHAAGHPDGTAQVLRFGIALWRYWVWHDHCEEAVALLVPVLRRPEASADPALLAEALYSAACVTSDIDVTLSVQLCEQMDQVASQLRDNRLLAMSRGHLAWVYRRSGEHERARLLGQESVQRARDVGDDVLLAGSIVQYAATMSTTPLAMSLFTEAIACCERSGNVSEYYHLQANLGARALLLGDTPAARAHMEAAVRAAQAIGYSSAYAPVNLGLALRADHDLDAARRAFEEGLRLGRRTGSKGAMATALHGLACLAADMGDWPRAATLHGAAQALLDQTGNQWDTFEGGQAAESLEHTAAAIGEEQLRQAYEQGTGFSISQAIDLALGKPGPSLTPQ
jgi:predicted ATPase/transcriptional regulator with XRE-family HTH domain